MSKKTTECLCSGTFPCCARDKPKPNTSASVARVISKEPQNQGPVEGGPLMVLLIPPSLPHTGLSLGSHVSFHSGVLCVAHQAAFSTLHGQPGSLLHALVLMTPLWKPEWLPIPASPRERPAVSQACASPHPVCCPVLDIRVFTFRSFCSLAFLFSKSLMAFKTRLTCHDISLNTYLEVLSRLGSHCDVQCGLTAPNRAGSQTVQVVILTWPHAVLS